MRQRLESSIRALAEHRGPRSSICLSDAARDVARRLAQSGAVEITQRGTVVDPDSDWTGPIRIRTTAS
ncbi:DUF3253 domain-containing protein [Mycobacterium nebraskense]|uniref:S-adenosylmethionine tRNA ribosyltransferase n=1 Tax=Mycobacterium nebraskense TaxID=244292 RepID=A0A0F5NEC7_9MYCO|nr:DUF3253 domain-containing protein [Mycobacterium nebraskense]KKC05265.1 hypothetical protein WU83_09285 [Mycobacterium nebraskense]KLO33975.1 hypothetical protein ABW17_27460 [Mycobacterium nebraskense]MBI2693673.1 DUF3253 domain-containing protein [Mycobacterium nebraskense]MCV7119823.1 DUF3253 domain-containing protein [Mycobacterium nebraskense]ORW25247.1 hypothetical protein AWC17_01975 [Mycobacterium nebraskense]